MRYYWYTYNIHILYIGILGWSWDCDLQGTQQTVKHWINGLWEYCYAWLQIDLGSPNRHHQWCASDGKPLGASADMVLGEANWTTWLLAPHDSHDRLSSLPWGRFGDSDLKSQISIVLVVFVALPLACWWIEALRKSSMFRQGWGG